MKISTMVKHLCLVLVLIGSYTTQFAQTPPSNVKAGIDQLFQRHVDQTSGLVPGNVIRVEKPGEWVYDNAAVLAYSLELLESKRSG